MTAMLVIDTTSRTLAVYTADVTQAETGLVIREGLEIGPLQLLVPGGRDWQNPVETGMPVLVLGDGYQAQSSAGFVRLSGRARGRQAVVVGRLDANRPLRLIRPTPAELFAPGRLMAQRAHSNSNWGTASAALQGVALLDQVQVGLTLVEGQSDRTSVWRLLGERGDPLFPFVGALDPEHRAERFTPAAVGAAAARAHARMSEHDHLPREATEWRLRDAIGVQGAQPQWGWASLSPEVREAAFAASLSELDRLDAEARERAEVTQPVEGPPSSEEEPGEWVKELEEA